MSRKKKLIIFAVLLAVAVMAYITVTELTKKDDVGGDTENELLLFECEKKDITEISYKSEAISYTVASDGEGYVYVDDPTFPLDCKGTEPFFDFASHIEYIKALEDGAENYGEYGLDNPKSVLTVTYGGKVFKLNIGNYNQYIDMYYCCVDGTDRVYLIGDTYTYYYDISLDEIIEHEKLTVPDEEYEDIVRYDISYSDGEGFVLEYIPGESEVDDEGNEKIISEDKWKKTLSDGTVISGDHSDDASALYKAMFENEHTEWIDYNAYTGGKLGKYGLDKPEITVTATYKIWESAPTDDAPAAVRQSTEQVEVFLGDRLPTGENADAEAERYYRIENGEIVYAVTESEFEMIFRSEN